MFEKKKKLQLKRRKHFLLDRKPSLFPFILIHLFESNNTAWTMPWDLCWPCFYASACQFPFTTRMISVSKMALNQLYFNSALTPGKAAKNIVLPSSTLSSWQKPALREKERPALFLGKTKIANNPSKQSLCILKAYFKTFYHTDNTLFNCLVHNKLFSGGVAAGQNLSPMAPTKLTSWIKLSRS